MKESKHTPGPWRVKNTNNGWMVLAPQNGYILTLVPRCRGIERIESNAARIVECVNACEGLEPAAIPDLLAAAEAVSDLYGEQEWNGPLAALRAAIRAAKGGE